MSSYMKDFNLLAMQWAKSVLSGAVDLAKVARAEAIDVLKRLPREVDQRTILQMNANLGEILLANDIIKLQKWARESSAGKAVNFQVSPPSPKPERRQKSVETANGDIPLGTQRSVHPQGGTEFVEKIFQVPIVSRKEEEEAEDVPTAETPLAEARGKFVEDLVNRIDRVLQVEGVPRPSEIAQRERTRIRWIDQEFQKLEQGVPLSPESKERLKYEFKCLLLKLKDCRSQNRVLVTTLEQRMEVLKGYESRLEEYQRKCGPVPSLEKTMEAERERLKYKTQLEQYELQSRKMKEEHERMLKELDAKYQKNAEKAVVEKDKEIADLQNLVERHKQDQAKLIRRIQDLDAALKHPSAANPRLYMEMRNQITKEITDLQKQRGQLMVDQNAYKRLEESLQNAVTRIQELTARLSECEGQRIQFEREKSMIRGEVDTLKRHYRECQEALRSRPDQATCYEALNKERVKRHEVEQQLRMVYGQLQTYKKIDVPGQPAPGKLLAEIERLKRENRELKSGRNLMGIWSARSKMVSRVDELEQENNNLKEQLAKIKEENRLCHSNAELLKQRGAEIEKLMSDKKSMEKVIQELRAQVEGQIVKRPLMSQPQPEPRVIERRPGINTEQLQAQVRRLTSEKQALEKVNNELREELRAPPAGVSIEEECRKANEVKRKYEDLFWGPEFSTQTPEQAGDELRKVNVANVREALQKITSIDVSLWADILSEENKANPLDAQVKIIVDSIRNALNTLKEGNETIGDITQFPDVIKKIITDRTSQNARIAELESAIQTYQITGAEKGELQARLVKCNNIEENVIQFLKNNYGINVSIDDLGKVALNIGKPYFSEMEAGANIQEAVDAKVNELKENPENIKNVKYVKDLEYIASGSLQKLKGQLATTRELQNAREEIVSLKEKQTRHEQLQKELQDCIDNKNKMALNIADCLQKGQQKYVNLKETLITFLTRNYGINAKIEKDDRIVVDPIKPYFSEFEMPSQFTLMPFEGYNTLEEKIQEIRNNPEKINNVDFVLDLKNITRALLTTEQESDEKVKELNQRLVENTKTLSQLERNVAEKDRAAEQKDEQVSRLNGEIENLRKELANQNQARTRLEGDLDKITQELNACQQKERDLVKEKQQLETQLSELREQSQKEKATELGELEKLRVDLANRNQTITRLEDELDKRTQELNACLQKEEDLVKEKQQLETQLSGLREQSQKEKATELEELEKLRVDLTNLEAELEKRTEELNASQQKEKETVDENTNMKDENDGLKLQLTQCNEQIQNLNVSVEKLNEEKENINDELKELNDRVVQLETEKVALQNSLEEANEKLTTCQQEKGNMDEKDNEVARKDAEIAEKNVEIQNLKEQIVQKDAEIAEKNGEIQNLNEEIVQKDAEIAEKNGEIQTLNEQFAQKDAENTEKNGEIRNLNEQIAQKDAEIAEKNGEIQNLNEQIAQKDAETAEKNGEIQNLNEQIAQKDTEIEEKTKLLNNLENVEKELQDLQTQKAELQIEIDRLQDELKSKPETKEGKDLQKELDDCNETIRRFEDLVTELEVDYTYYRNLKEIFAERGYPNFEGLIQQDIADAFVQFDKGVFKYSYITYNPAKNPNKPYCVSLYGKSFIQPIIDSSGKKILKEMCYSTLEEAEQRWGQYMDHLADMSKTYTPNLNALRTLKNDAMPYFEKRCKEVYQDLLQENPRVSAIMATAK
jgi:golgin subfamily B member 1